MNTNINMSYWINEYTYILTGFPIQHIQSFVKTTVINRSPVHTNIGSVQKLYAGLVHQKLCQHAYTIQFLDEVEQNIDARKQSQIIDRRATDKSRYFSTIELNKCFNMYQVFSIQKSLWPKV